MRVCIDIQAAIAQGAGVGRYTKALVENLARVAGQDHLRLFCFNFRHGGTPLKVNGAEVRSVDWCPGQVAQKAWNTLRFPPFEWFAGKCDLYHFPNFILPPLGTGRSIVTIHDVSFLRLPDMAEEANLRHLKSRIADTVRRADAILTDSKFSAGEIVELLGAKPDKIHVIYPGVANDAPAPGEVAITGARRAYGLDKPYILTVGTIEPRKNIPFIIEVFENMTAYDGCLVIAGMLGWKYEPILARMRSSPRASRIRYIGYVPEEKLQPLYAGADLFLFASVYEGFGFPPLEAMAAGTPVLSSAAGPLREVLGDGAVLLDEFDPSLWAHQATRSLRDLNLAIRGWKHATSKFSWEAAAHKVWDLYRRVCG